MKPSIQLFHPRRLGFQLKRHIAHRQHLVDQKDIGVGSSGDGKGQTHQHAGGIVSHGHGKEFAQFGELADAIELGPYTGGRLAVEVRAKDDILPPCRFVLEAEGNIEQRADPAFYLDASLRRGVDPRE